MYITAQAPPISEMTYTVSSGTLYSSIPYHLRAFTDDTQLYLHCRRADTASASAQLERCITDAGYWMSANRL